MYEAEQRIIHQQPHAIDEAFRNYSPELKNLCLTLLIKDPR